MMMHNTAAYRSTGAPIGFALRARGVSRPAGSFVTAADSTWAGLGDAARTGQPVTLLAAAHGTRPQPLGRRRRS